MDCFVPRNDRHCERSVAVQMTVTARNEAVHKADFEEFKLQQSDPWIASCLAMTGKQLLDCFVPRNDGEATLGLLRASQ